MTCNCMQRGVIASHKSKMFIVNCAFHGALWMSHSPRHDSIYVAKTSLIHGVRSVSRGINEKIRTDDPLRANDGQQYDHEVWEAWSRYLDSSFRLSDALYSYSSLSTPINRRRCETKQIPTRGSIYYCICCIRTAVRCSYVFGSICFYLVWKNGFYSNERGGEARAIPDVTKL
jgi:hypothetical protein